MSGEQKAHQGTLTNTTLPSLLYSILRRGETGVLTLQDHGVQKSLYIRDGRPLFATSTDPEDRLGNLLLKMGKVSLLGMHSAVERSSSQKKRLGTILVEMSLIRPEDLVEGVLAQVKGIILNLFQWTQGRYDYKSGPLPTDEVITLKLNADRITLDGIRAIDRWERVWEAVGPLDARYQVAKAPPETVKALGLSAADAALLARLDKPVSLQELCGQKGANDFDMCRLLWALKTLGLVKRV